MFNYSPLRYPGGKSRIAGFIAQIIGIYTKSAMWYNEIEGVIA